MPCDYLKTSAWFFSSPQRCCADLREFRDLSRSEWHINNVQLIYDAELDRLIIINLPNENKVTDMYKLNVKITLIGKSVSYAR